MDVPRDWAAFTAVYSGECARFAMDAPGSKSAAEAPFSVTPSSGTIVCFRLEDFGFEDFKVLEGFIAPVASAFDTNRTRVFPSTVTFL